MKFLNKLMNKLGYVPQQQLQEQINLFNEFFDKPKMRDISRKELEKFYEIWEKEMTPKYVAYLLRSTSKNPELLLSLISAIAQFDFVKVNKYMTETNWFWCDYDKVPSYERMIENVLSLAALSLDEEHFQENIKIYGNSTVESGGFSVTRTKDNQFKIKFEFNKL